MTPLPRASSYFRKMRRTPCFSSSSVRLLAMYPSSCRILAIEAFSRDAGTSTRRCRACCALRMRVSRSALGSAIDIVPYSSSSRRRTHGAPRDHWPFQPAARRSTPAGANPSPARLDHARDLSAQCQLTEADPTHAEVAQEPARPPAAVAAVVLAHLELRLHARLGDACLGRHSLSLDSFESSPRRSGHRSLFH